MSLWNDLAAARADEYRLHAEWTAAAARLAALEAVVIPDAPDVSEFQGDVDWAKVKSSGAQFAFVRASDGDKVDARFTAARITAMRAAGLIVGVYHFARPGNANNGYRTGAMEAAMSIYPIWKAGGLRAGDLPMVYDFENESIAGIDPVAAAAHLVRWVRVYNYMMAHRPIIYTNSSTMNVVYGALSDSEKTFLAGCPLWVAHTGVATPTVPAPWTSWDFWQYTWSASIAGIAGSVDLNRFNGAAADLKSLLIK